MEASTTVFMFIKIILTTAYMRERGEKGYRWLLRNNGSLDLSKDTEYEKKLTD